MSIAPWQVRLYRKSLMKKEKVRLVRKLVSFDGRRILDMACAQGTVSFQLKKAGGEWLHADLDLQNLREAKQVLGNAVLQVGPALPCRDATFDLVLVLDYLEHVADDCGALAECRRILKPAGRIVVSTPHNGHGLLLSRLKGRLGLTPEVFGHVRPGYSPDELGSMLRESGFTVVASLTYAKFFVEFFEVLLDWFFVRKKRKKSSVLRTGGNSPQSDQDLDGSRGLFRLYACVFYPVVWLLTRFDRLLFWKTGYATLVVGEKK